MVRAGLVIIWLLTSALSQGQVRLSRLELKPKEIYTIKDTVGLVVDSLIMRDSSKLILNGLRSHNSIRAKAAVFYRGCTIDGKGMRGTVGRTGRAGTSPTTPCADGTVGLIGSRGADGGKGINLSLYLTEIIVRGSLFIDVSGGDAGDGGQGGPGGGGGAGTRLCTGGNGGKGGNGANGGNGGNGGTVTFIAPRIPELRSMLGEKIVIRNYGGNQGLGGNGGIRGFSGLSPVGNPKMDGKSGKKGDKGKDGIQGKPGAVFFQDK